jgi:dienelactone hydrolase
LTLPAGRTIITITTTPFRKLIMKCLLCALGISLFLFTTLALPASGDAPRAGMPADHRLGKPKTLDDYFPFTPPATREAWEARRKAVREQMLVATGLWPMPEKAPLHPVIHGKIERDDYTIEKVFFASYPGHYVSGNLYRPKGRTGRVPGVLCPHGHWPNGRFYDALAAYNEKKVQQEIQSGAEKTVEGARFPLQARCAQLARMGCVVFHYDMVGIADSQQTEHRVGFTDAEAELRLQSFMGLQTFNSIRALDFLTSLPDVDAKRIGVTGASGGGTQTFMLCAIDDRPTVAFPAVMVSTAMQGGCVCENCSYLRQGTGNIEFAALFAPKPLGMSAANDWTKEIETKGLPELKALYRLYGAENHVMARAFLQFEHNYNQVSREVMYNWFNKHLQLGQPEPVMEKPFVPVPPAKLSVYDASHPRPADAADMKTLRKTMTEASDRQMEALRPHDQASLEKFQRVVGTALRVMIGDTLPPGSEVESRIVKEEAKDGVQWRKLHLGRKGQHEQIPAIEVRGKDCDGTVVVWIHPAGKASLLQNGKLVPGARNILNHKAAILAPDVFLTGEFAGAPAPSVNEKYAGFTFGYNRPLLANRVHDILTAVAYAQENKAKTIHLLGLEKAGPWVVLARALCGRLVARTVADLNHFRFETVHSTSDEMMLPGALKYGGLPAYVGLCSAGELYLHNCAETGLEVGDWVEKTCQLAGIPVWSRVNDKEGPDLLVLHLLH